MRIVIKSKIKKIKLRLTENVNHLRSNINCKHIWYGNNYGGFYVYPNNLDENSIVYSFGIGDDISFDKKVAETHNCHIFCFDPTPKSINWIKNQKLPEKLHFFEYGISIISGQMDFYLPKNPEHISGSLVVQNNINDKGRIIIQTKSIMDIMNELGHNHIDLLKMDIEGAEYDVIEDILNSKVPINQILIEFHDRFFENGRAKSKHIVNKLTSYSYEIFAVSDSLDEISFIKIPL